MGNNRALYLFAGTIGGIAGGYLPSLWGAGDFSLWSVFLSTVGGILGIVIAYRLINR